MTTMIGRLRKSHWHIGCDCISSRSIKTSEDRQWRREWADEQGQYDRGPES